jgi:nucleoside-diphosphate-sugar epimerase
MKLLVLGGTVFLSRAVAEQAVRRGHDVTAACRGTSGTLPDGVRHLRLDRETESLADVLPAGATSSGRPPFDAVVDIARQPQRVRDAVRALPDAHWVFVSTINVYADESARGGTPETLALRDPILEDGGDDSAESYGAKKVGCEQIVTDGAASSVVIRPGLIIGPGDPSGRFTYWPSRLAGGGEVLAPGRPEERVQVVDVRDLAAWIVDAAERRLTGVYDGTGPAMSRGEFLERVARGVSSPDSPDSPGSTDSPAEPTSFTWVPQEFLAEQKVEPWSGPRSVPVWLPLPEYAGLCDHDVTASLAAGLTVRPLEESARDTLAWLRATPDGTVTGLTRDEESEVLLNWHQDEDERAQRSAGD